MQTSPPTIIESFQYGLKTFFQNWKTFFKASLIVTLFFLCTILLVGALITPFSIWLFGVGSKIIWGKLVSLFYSLEKADFAAWLNYFYNLKRFAWIQIGYLLWIPWQSSFSLSVAYEICESRLPFLRKIFIHSFTYFLQFLVFWFLYNLPLYLKVDNSYSYLSKILIPIYQILSLYYVFKVLLTFYFIVQKKYTDKYADHEYQYPGTSAEQAMGASWQLTQNHFFFNSKNVATDVSCIVLYYHKRSLFWLSIVSATHKYTK